MMDVFVAVVVGFVVLVPIVMTILLVGLSRKRRILARLWSGKANAMGFEPIEIGDAAREEMSELCSRTLGRVDEESDFRVTEAMVGEVEGRAVSIVRVGSVRREGRQDSRAVTELATFVTAHGLPDGLAISHAEPKGRLRRVVTRAIGVRAAEEAPDGDPWAWLRTNSPDRLEELGLPDSVAAELSELIVAGGTVITFDDAVVHLTPCDDAFDLRAIEAYLDATRERVSAILRLIVRD